MSKFRLDESWRFNIVLAFISIIGLVVLSRLFFIQVIKGEYYKALAQGQYNQAEDREFPRGEVFFSKGEPLAVNMEWPLVFASPVEIEEESIAAEELAAILNLDKDFILARFKESDLYSPIKKRLTPGEAAKIEEANIKGIHLGKESGRYYPQETIASKLAGFVDQENIGQYGLEGDYDDILRGRKNGPGSDLILTIDYAIQYQAERLLKEAKEKLEFESAEIVAMDPRTGRILAMASHPNFDPNNYSKVADFDIFQNPSTQKIFEPGSVFKPLTMAAAINEGRVAPQTTYNDPGQIRIGGYKVYNYGQKQYPGQLTMTNVLEKSINTGAVWAMQQLGNVFFSKYVEGFGVFEPTNIDLKEIYSENQEFKKGYEINYVTASFGQGLEMTPIQLMRAYSAVANGGRLVKPYVVEEIKSVDGSRKINPGIGEKQIITSKTTSQITAMLVSVVENGYAKSAQIPGYYVGGKTGTAQVSWSALDIDKKGYSDQTWQSFIGYAPAFDPKFLILVKLDNPKTNTAEYSAVPIFHDLAKYIIDYWQIPPDYE